MKHLKKLGLLMMVMLIMVPSSISAKDDDVRDIVLNSQSSDGSNYTFTATLDGKTVTEYDYTWHIDPNGSYSEVKNSPGEYYTGTEPQDEDVYIAHDIYYYPELDTGKFVQGRYGDDTEWLYYYDNEKYSQYVFSTLPVEGSSVPTRMMHSESEAYNNAVLHINKAGTYRLSGSWHGQIYIDLGDDSFDDETAVVTLILNNVDIECTVASGICFYQVYECDNAWEDRDDALTTIDTASAGANVVIADGSTNSVSGANIYRLLKTKYKDENSTDAIKEQKKRLKVDGALYSYMSLNVNGGEKGTGTLTINSEFEGLDSELHMTINGGNINIVSDNDGINVNEDNISIFTMNGGVLQILAGTGYEGDGIDSNGYLNINGGTVISSAKPQSDSGLDSDCGTFINGGNVLAFGSSMDVVDEYNEDAQSVTMNLAFSSQQSITRPLVFTTTDDKGVCGFDLSGNAFFSKANRTYQCLIISTSAFTVGSEYYVYTASTLKGTDINGFYTALSKFTKTAQLAYSSSQIGMGGFNNRPNGGFNQNNGNTENTNPSGGVSDEETDPFAQQQNGQGFQNQNGNGQMPNAGGNGNFGGNENFPGNFGGNGDGQMPNFDGNGNLPGNSGGNTEGQMPNVGENGNFGGNTDGQMPNFDGNSNFPGNFNNNTGESNTIFKAEDKVNSFGNITTVAVDGNNANGSIQLTPLALVGIIAGALVVGVGAALLISKLIKSKNAKKEDIIY